MSILNSQFVRPIHHTFAPLGDLGQCLRALGLLLCPWKWKRGASMMKLQQELRHFFLADAFVFASGREGLRALLTALELRSGEEVIVQGYTCVVVPNAIHAAGGKPVFVDCEADTLNLEVEAAEAAINPHTRVVICQHTFGIPADVKKLRALCDAHHLFLIEDCAHVIPDSIGPADIGRLGDAVLLSFGRDKAISGVAGGAILCRSKSVAQNLHTQERFHADLPALRIVRLLLYPLLYALARPLYGIGVGKALLSAARSVGLLIPILEPEEKRGAVSPLLHRLPNALASLALAQWRKRRRINDHRRMLTNFYCKNLVGAYCNTPLRAHIPAAITPDLPLQKFPIFINNAQELRQRLRKHNIHLDDGWTGCVICPDSVAIDALHYQWGTDPVAESLCTQILSLPTHPGMSLKDARRLVEEVDAGITNIECGM